MSEENIEYWPPTLQAIKIQAFKNPKWWMPAILKIEIL